MTSPQVRRRGPRTEAAPKGATDPAFWGRVQLAAVNTAPSVLSCQRMPEGKESAVLCRECRSEVSDEIEDIDLV